MRFVTAEEVMALVSSEALIARLAHIFADGSHAPPRQVVSLPAGGTLLVMPAVAPDGTSVVKTVTVLPENSKRGLPTIQGGLIYLSSRGTPLALIDAGSVTRLRTAAASALASRYLSRPKSRRLVMIGTGALAPYLVAAHSSVRPLEHIAVVGRDKSKAASTISRIRDLGHREMEIVVADDPEEEVSQSDIISCATSSSTPVLFGRWLKPGTFIDLVGSFSPEAREADDDVMAGSRIFVDSFEGALAEAGDILDPLARGIIDRRQIEAELTDLVTGRARGRMNNEEILTFKSVGTAVEDLATAQLIAELLPLRE